MKTIGSFIVSIFMGIQATHAMTLEHLVASEGLEELLKHRTVGYYLGSFDPVHKGHESLVQECLDQKLCDYILIFPAWGGDDYKIRTDVKVRQEMLFAIFEHHPKVIVTKYSPQELQSLLMVPSGDKDVKGRMLVESKFQGTKYIGVIGSDTAISLSKNMRKQNGFLSGIQIPEPYAKHTIGGLMAVPSDQFIVSLRGTDDISDLKGFIGNREIIRVLENTEKFVSSTLIRKKLQSGESIEDLVHPGVIDVISRHNLYLKHN